MGGGVGGGGSNEHPGRRRAGEAGPGGAGPGRAGRHVTGMPWGLEGSGPLRGDTKPKRPKEEYKSLKKREYPINPPWIRRHLQDRRLIAARLVLRGGVESSLAVRMEVAVAAATYPRCATGSGRHSAGCPTGKRRREAQSAAPVERASRSRAKLHADVPPELTLGGGFGIDATALRLQELPSVESQAACALRAQEERASEEQASCTCLAALLVRASCCLILLLTHA